MYCTLEESHLPFDEYGDGGLCHHKDWYFSFLFFFFFLFCFVLFCFDVVLTDVKQNLMHMCFCLKSCHFMKSRHFGEQHTVTFHKKSLHRLELPSQQPMMLKIEPLHHLINEFRVVTSLVSCCRTCLIPHAFSSLSH
jgi:hypothetical protein